MPNLEKWIWGNGADGRRPHQDWEGLGLLRVEQWGRKATSKTETSKGWFIEGEVRRGGPRRGKTGALKEQSLGSDDESGRRPAGARSGCMRGLEGRNLEKTKNRKETEDVIRGLAAQRGPRYEIGLYARS